MLVLFSKLLKFSHQNCREQKKILKSYIQQLELLRNYLD